MTASTHARPLMVGVAASAGGLEALTHLLRHLDPSAPLSLIIAQHLSPDHESMLTTLLSRESKIPVESARNNTTIKVGHAYVIPPVC